MTAINEKTTITIGLVIALIGGSGFITRVWYSTEANAEAIVILKSDLKEDLRAIKEELKQQNRLLLEVLARQDKLKK